MGALFFLFLLATELAEEFPNTRLRHLDIPRTSERACFGELFLEHGIVRIIDIDVVRIDVLEKFISYRLRPDSPDSGERACHAHAVVLR